MITGITRVRNESLIIEDTLKHWLQFCESIVLYDDASYDNTADLAATFGRVRVLRGKKWLVNRPAEETRHRKMLLAKVQTPWTFCFDADERLVGNLPDLTADAYRFRLFDGYMAVGHKYPYAGGSLLDLKRLWGPEFRDILMLFKTGQASYSGLDRREPIFRGVIERCTAYIKHYGKCLSTRHWEETCDYYAHYWPEPYKSKWARRKGQAIHSRSDFGRELYTWWDLMTHKTGHVRL